MNICVPKREEISSFDQRLEKFLSWKDHRSKFWKRGHQKRHDDNVIIVRKRFDQSRNVITRLDDILADIFMTANLVTNDGDQYYAESGCAQTPTVPFNNANGRMQLGNGSQGTPNKTNTYSALVGPISASRKALNAGYPRTADPDTDNTGSGVKVATWLTSWLSTDFNDPGITGGVIDDAGSSPISSSKLLTYWTITAFAKTSTDTLKVFVNHTLSGV